MDAAPLSVPTDPPGICSPPLISTNAIRNGWYGGAIGQTNYEINRDNAAPCRISSPPLTTKE